MSLAASRAAVAGPHGPLLLPTSLDAAPGEVTVVMADPGPASTTLALALGGRLPLSEGIVTLDGDADPSALRHRVALVDVPGVTEPEPGLPTCVVVGEELALAGLPARRRDIDAFLAERDSLDRATTRWEMLRPDEQTAWLCDIVAQRPGVDAVVLTSPDRRGGDPRGWYAAAAALAERGRVVVALAAHASASLLGLTHSPTTFEAGIA